jgi:hypothetical protein
MGRNLQLKRENRGMPDCVADSRDLSAGPR